MVREETHRACSYHEERFFQVGSIFLRKTSKA